MRLLCSQARDTLQVPIITAYRGSQLRLEGHHKLSRVAEDPHVGVNSGPAESGSIFPTPKPLAILILDATGKGVGLSPAGQDSPGALESNLAENRA